MKRLSRLIMLLLLLLIPMSAPVEAAEQFCYTFELQSAVLTSAPGISPAALPEIGSFDYSAPGYGAQLEDPIALIAYQSLEQQLTPECTTVTVDLSSLILDTPDQIVRPIQAALSAFSYDHPESQYCRISNYRLSYYLNGEGKVINAAITYLVAQDPQSAAMKESLDTCLETFRAGFNTALPAAEQYRAIHDYICDLAVYNHKAAAAGVPSDAHTVYGLLVLKDAVVCEGYAKSFKVLCDAVGLPCILVSGEALRPDADGNVPFTGISNHMWNAVEVDGEWYCVDVTWDDIDMAQGDLPGCPDIAFTMASYTYFLDNTPFLTENPAQDHRSSGNIYFQSSFPMTFALPELAQTPHSAADVSVGHLTISYSGTALEIPNIFWNYQFNGISPSDLSNITLRLSEDQTLSRSFRVPAGKSYVLEAATPLTISRAEGFEAPMFLLNGSLTCRNVTCDSAPGLPLASVSGGSLSGLDCSQMTLNSPYAPEDLLCVQAVYGSSGALENISFADPTSGSVFSPAESPLHSTRTFLLNAHTFAPVAFDLIS